MNDFINKTLKFAVLLIPVILISLAIVLAFLVNRLSEDVAKERFESSTDNLYNSVHAQLDNYITFINSARRAFTIQDDFDRADWISYFDIINSISTFEGISSVAYVSVIDKADVNEYLEKQINDKSYVYEGLENMSVSSSSTDNTIYPVTYIFPLEELKNVIGYDIGQESVREKAINRAVSSGLPSASDTIRFILTDELGFHLTAPLYEKGSIPITQEESEEKLKSLITLSFNVQDVFSAIFNNTPQYNDLYFSIKDSDKVLYESSVTTGEDAFYKSKNIEFGGQTWMIEFKAEKTFGNSLPLQFAPSIIVLTGIILSILSGLIIYLVIFTSYRAEDLAKKLTKGLKDSEEKMKSILNNTSTIISLKDLNGKYLFVNNSFKENLKLNYQRLENRLDIDLFQANVARQIGENEKQVIEIRDERTFEETLPTISGKKKYFL